MKNMIHWINSILCIALMALGVVMLLLRPSSEEETSSIILIAAILQIVMSFVVFMIGVLLPKKDRYASKGMQRFLKIIIALSALSGNGPGSPTAYDLASGELMIRRFWEPAFPLVWLAFESILLYFFEIEGAVYTVSMISQLLLLLLFVCTFSWSILDHKDRGTFRWTNIIVPSLVILVIFGAIAGYTAIQNGMQGPSLNQQLIETRKEIDKILESPADAMESGKTISNENMDMEDIVALIQRDFSSDVYYRWIGGEDDIYNMVVWTDDSEDVYVYQFTREEGLYRLNMTFISESISKEDVESKEDGVIPVN